MSDRQGDEVRGTVGADAASSKDAGEGETEARRNLFGAIRNWRMTPSELVTPILAKLSGWQAECSTMALGVDDLEEQRTWLERGDAVADAIALLTKAQARGALGGAS
jgi:hypothetical protein